MAKSIDWESVEGAYRAGIRSLKDIGAEFGVSDAGIIKRAKRDGWARNLAAKIAARAEAKVSAAVVSDLVSAQRAFNEERIIEANATFRAAVVMQQRNDVSRARRLTQQLFDELELLICGSAELEQMADILAIHDDGKMQGLLAKVLALPTKTDVVKKLTEAMRILVEIERKVLRINDEEENKGGSIEDFLRQLPPLDA